MKSIKIIIAVLFLSASGIFAQVPNAINFQAIARDANGDVISSTDIMIRLTVINGSVNGQEIYQELRALTTNEYGSFAFQIGQDADYVTIGTFEDIQWNIGNKYLKIDYDPTNQFDWSLTLGTIEFGTVPYAFAAGTVSYIDLSGVQDGDVLLYNAGTGMFEPGQISGGTVEWSNIQNVPNFATVATSGDYNDLTNTPNQIWTENGSNIYFNDGNVGIGTIAIPDRRLVIASENSQAQIILNDELANLNQKNWFLQSRLGQLRFGTFNDDVSVNSDLFTISNNGNVAIGTTNPTSKLQVVGLPEYADNAAALAGGLTVGAFYRTGDILKVVH